MRLPKLYRRRRQAHLAWTEVKWPRPLGWETVQQLVHRIVADPGLGHVVFETRATSRGVVFALGVHPHHADRLARLVADLVPGIRPTKAIKPLRSPITTAGQVSVTGPRLVLDPNRAEALTRAMLAGFNGLADDERLVLQLHIGGRIPAAQLDRPSWWHTLLGSVPTTTAVAVPRSTRSGAGAFHAAKVCLRLGATATTPVKARLLIMNLFGGLRVAESAGSRLRIGPCHPAPLDRGTPPRQYRLRLTAPEIACLAGLPIGQGDLPALPPAAPRMIPSPEWTPAASTRACLVDATDTSKTVGIPEADARLHTVMLGATGSGKSTTLEHLILADIYAGRSVVVLDPKNDLVADLLERIPEHRVRDVVVINPTSSQPVGLNPLADSNREPNLVTDSLLATFKSLFADSWGVRTEEILTASVLTLTQTSLPEAKTLVAIPSLLTNPEFRRRILASVSDPLGTGRFWAKYQAMSPEQQSTIIAPVLNKLQQFFIRPHMRAVLGQTTPRFQLDEVLNSPKIVLLSLNKGILGPESARLLGSLFIGQLWLDVLGRSRQPHASRRHVSVFVDEVHDYLGSIPGDLADALAQSRSLGVAWHVAHQYRSQLTPAMRVAIDTNCRNKICFGLGMTDASDMAKQTGGTLTPADFVGLPAYHAYVNVWNGNRATGWFTAKTMPPPPAIRLAVDLVAASSTRYGQPTRDTEDTLIQITGLTPHNPSQASPPGSNARHTPEASGPVTSVDGQGGSPAVSAPEVVRPVFGRKRASGHVIEPDPPPN